MFALYENDGRQSARDVRTMGLARMFVMCEQDGMQTDRITSIAALREEMKLTLEEFGSRIGLKSKGQVSEIEKSNKCSPEVALEIEKLSSRRLDASLLNATIEAARRSIAA